MSPGLHYPLRELAESIAYELGRQGVVCTNHVGGFPEPRPDRVYALVAPRAYVAELGAHALPEDSVLKKTVFVSAERPTAFEDPEHVELLRRAGAVFDVEQRSVLAMRRLGIPARALRPGYSELRDHFDADAERPIDVMFLGTHSPRRTAILSRAARVLARHNCLLQIAPDVPAAGNTSSFLADSRWSLLAQTKVVINLHRYDEPYFEWQRAIDAMHAGAVVVSEPSTGIAPFAAGEHLLMAAPDALPYVVDSLLHDPDRLAALRRQAYERLRSWVPFALSIGVLRAAIVELVGQPVAPDAIRGGAPPPAQPSPRLDARDGEVATMRRELAAASREVSGIRQQLTRLEETVARASSAGGRIEIVHKSDAWAALRAPRTSVITTLTDDEPGVAETLDSLATGVGREVELVVVATGAVHRNMTAAAAWLRRHPRIPSVLLRMAGAGGVGAARNVALDFARGRYCLTVDPGRALYPRALDVLPAMLDAMPDVAFAYPMQALARPAGRTADHVLSFLGWDPDRLRHGSYIASPALIRTDRLRAVGGFATDARLAGLEDHDLWCRFAERGWRGQLVSQLLARSTASSSGPVVAGLGPVGPSAMAALAERAPALLADAVSAS